MLPNINGRPSVNGSAVAANTGSAAGAASLFSGIAQEARRYRARLQPDLNEEYREQAANDVMAAAAAREDGTSAIDVPTKRAFTQQGAVYNQVVQTNVLATAKADYADEIRRLEADHEYDPEGFQSAADAFLSKYSEGLDAPADLIMALEREGQGMFGAAGAKIEERTRIVAARETQDALQRRIGQIQAEISTLIENDGAIAMFSDEYAEREQELVDVVGILADNPAYGWSDEQAADVLETIANGSQELVSIQQMAGIYHDKGAAKALEFIDEAVNKMTLTQPERIGAVSRMQTELSRLQQLTNIEEDERKARDDAETEKMEGIAASFEAELLERMSEGEKPSAEDMRRARLLTSAGWLKPSRMQVYVRAMTSDDKTPSDEAYVSALYDFARTDGVTVEELQETTLLGVAEGLLKTSDREAILRAHETYNDDRYRAGQDILDGMFATGFMDIDTGRVKNAASMARSDLEDWVNTNPEATRSQIQQKARQLAVEHGRRVPPPPIPQVPGTASSGFIDPQNIQGWADDLRIRALEAYEAGQYDDAEFTRASQMIDERVAWQRSQTILQQENVNAPSERDN